MTAAAVRSIMMVRGSKKLRHRQQQTKQQQESSVVCLSSCSRSLLLPVLLGCVIRTTWSGSLLYLVTGTVQYRALHVDTAGLPA